MKVAKINLLFNSKIMENQLYDQALLLASAPVITVIIQIVKQAGFPSKFAGLLAVALGIGFVFLKNPDFSSDQLFINIITGIMAGASAAGIYSQYKTFAAPAPTPTVTPTPPTQN